MRGECPLQFSNQPSSTDVVSRAFHANSSGSGQEALLSPISRKPRCSNLQFYVIVKARFRVLYGKYSTRGRGRECHTARGGAECCMAFETAPSSAVYPVQHVGTVL